MNTILHKKKYRIHTIYRIYFILLHSISIYLYNITTSMIICINISIIFTPSFELNLKININNT